MTTDPIGKFFGNCDNWGAAEWFERLANAVMEQDKAVVAGDTLSAETYRNIAASSAMELVRGYRTQVRAALAKPASEPARGGVQVKPLQWESGDGIVHDTLSWRAEVKPLGLTYCVVERQWWLVGEHAAANLCESDAEAKVAAQADYERRIKSALSSPASSSPAEAEALPDGVEARLQKLHENAVWCVRKGRSVDPKWLRDEISAILASPAPAQAGSGDARSNGSALAGEGR